MYTKRLRLVNYGPLEGLDITLPFENDAPKPVLIVGENGAGKSILLSHMVNGLIEAKGVAYPDTPDVEVGKVYKIRSGSYIKSGAEYYFARVDFENQLLVGELRLLKTKKEYESIPTHLSQPEIQSLWDTMQSEAADSYMSSFSHNKKAIIDQIFAKNCILYFPPNRFEEPAWLNEENLKAQAHFMDLEHLAGRTTRKVIDYSPLHDNQNWLFDLIYDRATFEIQTHDIGFPISNGDTVIHLPVFAGYSGLSARIYEVTLQMVRVVTRREDARFGIGKRNNRVVSLVSDITGPIVPNIFQLSSGETSLLNLFLSIL